MAIPEPITADEYAASVVEAGGATLSLVRMGYEKRLTVRGDAAGFAKPAERAGDAQLFPLTHANAAELRRRLPWLRPVPLGLQISAGRGDRLGLATPGHTRAFHETRIAPIFAQQSIREMTRTNRTLADVLTDATWALSRPAGAGRWAQTLITSKPPRISM